MTAPNASRLRGAERPGSVEDGFVFYVEGARDRDLLRAWAYRLSPALERVLEHASVILGGRQPARAVEHFRAFRDAAGEVRGLCVLDRDVDAAPAPQSEVGLEFYTWGRRHIESYLLVPAAIRRALHLAPDDPRFERILRHQLPATNDETALREVNAKRLLGAAGSLSHTLGRSLPLGRIARAMLRTELHPDILALFERVRSGLQALGAPKGV